MQKKIGITIALTMLIVLMAGMTFLPTTVSAAGDVNTKGCAHTSLALCTPGNPWYPHADEYGHEKRVINEYYCTECYKHFWIEDITSEPHTYNSNYVCIYCHYSPIH